jgi:translation initiation factor 3 subunit A
VSQTNAALEGLRDIILSKRFRSTNHNAIEPIMMKFLELCVDQRKSKYTKECLHQYKNIVQNTNVTTIQVTTVRRREETFGKLNDLDF